MPRYLSYFIISTRKEHFSVYNLPVTGMYSWFNVGSAATFVSVDLTTGSTHGFPSAVRYAEN